MATPPTRALARMLGRRGATLAILGVAFLIIGVKALLAPVEPVQDRYLLYSLLPPAVRGVLWILPAILALVAAIKTTGRDGFGFAALAAPPSAMAFSYLWSSVANWVGLSPWPFGWTSALTWLMILALLSVIAGWPEPVQIREPRHKVLRGHRG
jgi:hypothetical protein